MSGVAGSAGDVVYATASLLWMVSTGSSSSPFGLNHTCFLNLLALAVAAVLVGLRRSRFNREQAGAHRGA